MEEVYGNTPYTVRDRCMGRGQIRIGNCLEFREDMYSLLFISMVKPLYKKNCEEEEQEMSFERLIATYNEQEEEKEIENTSQKGEESGSNLNQSTEQISMKDEQFDEDRLGNETILTRDQEMNRRVRQSSNLGSVLILAMM